MEEKEEAKITIKDIHHTFWLARDFELTNLWQRSIFLTAFLVLCFTAYGAVVFKIVDNLKNPDEFIILNIIAYLLFIIGAIFSIFWIKMGKGSKAWYEIYENAIGAFERNEKYAIKLASGIGGFNYRKLQGYYGHNNLDNNLFSGSAGEYSVSKINIAIGQVFLIIWSLVGVLHIVTASVRGFQSYLNCFVLIGLILLLLLAPMTYYLSIAKKFGSGSIGDFYPPPPPK